MSDIEERVKAIVMGQLGVDEGEVTCAASFTDDLGADSLDMVGLATAFEDEFGAKISDGAMEAFSNAKDVAGYIRAHCIPDRWGRIRAEEAVGWGC